MKVPFFQLAKLILGTKASIRFFIGAIIGFAFSIAVILSTIGLMDGFEDSLTSSLKKSSGDLVVKTYKGSFHKKELDQNLKKIAFKNATHILKTQAFLAFMEQSRGLIIHGVASKSFKSVTGLSIPEIKEGHIVLGQGLKQRLNISKGDLVSLIMSSRSRRNNAIPEQYHFKVQDFVSHGIFEKDERFAYLGLENLRQIMGVKDGVLNIAYLNLRDSSKEHVSDMKERLNTKLKVTDFYTRAYWEEYRSLLDAVKMEKMSITVILQLIVIVSIFNILAFIYFVFERQSQSFFLLKALGMSQKTLRVFWTKFLVTMWLTACFISIFFTFLFDYLIQNLSVFELPGDIYVLSKLSLKLSSFDYMLVFGLALFWVLIVGSFSIFRLKKKSLLSGLRQEFS